jgi:hypothetical protein
VGARAQGAHDRWPRQAIRADPGLPLKGGDRSRGPVAERAVDRAGIESHGGQSLLQLGDPGGIVARLVLGRPGELFLELLGVVNDPLDLLFAFGDVLDAALDRAGEAFEVLLQTAPEILGLRRRRRQGGHGNDRQPNPAPIHRLLPRAGGSLPMGARP